jgi:hypothetical protein
MSAIDHSLALLAFAECDDRLSAAVLTFHRMNREGWTLHLTDNMRGDLTVEGTDRDGQHAEGFIDLRGNFTRVD